MGTATATKGGQIVVRFDTSEFMESVSDDQLKDEFASRFGDPLDFYTQAAELLKHGKDDQALLALRNACNDALGTAI